MEYEFSITLTAQDLAEANWLMVRRHWMQRWAPWITLAIALVFGLVLVLSARYFHPDITPRKSLSVFAKGLMFALLFVGLQLFVVLRIIVRSTRPKFGEDDGHDVLYLIDNTAITMTAQGRTTSFPWSTFRRKIESPNWLLLTRSEATFCAFPKSQLDAATLEALKAAFANARNKPVP